MKGMIEVLKSIFLNQKRMCQFYKSIKKTFQVAKYENKILKQ